MKCTLQNKKITAFVLALLCGLALPVSVGAQSVEATDASSEPQVLDLEETMDTLLAWEISACGETSLQDWLDGYASDHPTDGNVESFLLGMEGCNGSSWDYASYEEALLRALSEEYSELSPTSLQKGILVLSGLPSEEETSPDWETLVSYAQNETIGEQGLMSLVYGLFVLENTGLTQEITEETLPSLLSYQCRDGGFALDGGSGDVDVTAMVLQALCIYRNQYGEGFPQEAAEAINRAFAFLKEEECPSGGYKNMGIETSESSAQVALALQAAGEDSLKFYGVLKTYLQEDGGLSHTLDGESNEMAAAEAFYCMSGMRRQLLGESFLFDHAAYADSDVSYGGNPDQGLGGGGSFIKWLTEDYRRLLSAGLLALWLAFLVICLLMLRSLAGQKEKKKQGQSWLYRLLGASGLCALCGVLVWTVHIQGRKAYLADRSQVLCDGPESNTIEVTLKITAETVGEGSILPETDCYVTEGANVYELLSEVCRKNDIQMEYTGSNSGYIYIQGIDYLYELDHGELSGWMYRVNGEFPDRGCNSYILQDGDEVEWCYTTDIGKDLQDD